MKLLRISFRLTTGSESKHKRFKSSEGLKTPMGIQLEPTIGIYNRLMGEQYIQEIHELKLSSSQEI